MVIEKHLELIMKSDNAVTSKSLIITRKEGGFNEQ